MANNPLPSKKIVDLQYVPVEYTELRDTGITEFLVSIENVQDFADIQIEDLSLEYYFYGIDNPPETMLSNPSAFFIANCRTQEGKNCDGVNLSIQRGVEGNDAARFLLRVTFSDTLGTLQAENYRGTFLSTESRDYLRLLLSIALPRSSIGINETLDYSYIDAPVSSISDNGNGTVVVRRPVENKKIPIYGNNRLIWGNLPESVNALPAIENSSNPRVSCNNDSGGCEIVAKYCCKSLDSTQFLDETIPIPWPPNLSSNNSTENGTTALFSDSESSISWIIGVCVGVSLSLLAFVGVFWWRRKRRQSLQPESKGNYIDHSNSESGSAQNDTDCQEKATEEDPPLSWVVPIHHRLGSDISNEILTSPSLQNSAQHTSSLQFQTSSIVSGDSLDQKSGTPTGVVEKAQYVVDRGNLEASPFIHGTAQGPAYYSGPGPLPDNLTQMIDMKCNTCPGIIRCSFLRNPLDTEGKAGSASEEDEEESSSTFSLQPWNVARSNSWSGILTQASDTDSHSAAEKIKRRRRYSNSTLNTILPPLSTLPPPLIPGAASSDRVNLHVPWSDIEKHIGKCLGTGGFGAVYEASWQGKKVAIKRLPPFVSLEGSLQKDAESAYQALIREIKLASKFQCERLVEVYGACTDDKAKCCLIMELMKGGNLHQRIYDRKRRRLTYIEILQLAHDIAQGLAYLHPSVIHGDLKPQNILLDEEGKAKIADFGISKVKDPSKSYLSQMTAENGTPMYMAPEQMNGGKIDEKVDVYALGCILNEAYTRKQPWRDSNHFFQIIMNVAINGERPWVDPEAPEPLKRLIKKCWHQDPHQRPSCADIVRRTDILIQEELLKWDKLSPAMGQHYRRVLETGSFPQKA